MELRIGEHRIEDFTDADLIVASPAVPPHNEYLIAARAAGVPVTTEIRLFVERCPATIVGITGTKGKSTTTAMLGEMLRPAFTVWVGGNIGRSLLPELGADRQDAHRRPGTLELHARIPWRDAVVAARERGDHAGRGSPRLAWVDRSVRGGKVEHPPSSAAGRFRGPERRGPADAGDGVCHAGAGGLFPAGRAPAFRADAAGPAQSA